MKPRVVVFLATVLSGMPIACSKPFGSPPLSPADSPTAMASPSLTAINQATPTLIPTNSPTSTPSVTAASTPPMTPTPTVTPNVQATATTQAIAVATHEALATATVQAAATAGLGGSGTTTFQPTATVTPLITATATITPTPYPISAWSLYATLGQYGTDGVNGDFWCPMGVAVGAGYLAVSDNCYKNIQVFNSTGTYLYSITPHSVPNGVTPSLFGLAIDSNGELYSAVCGTGANEVDGYVLGPTGYTYDYTWTAQGRMTEPFGIKIDADGNLVVADRGAGKVWNLAWADDSVLNQTTQGPYGFDPFDVALDGSGNLYVTDFYSEKIEEFNSQYVYTGFCFNGSGWPNCPSGLTKPLGICLDSQGKIFIADSDTGRVYCVTPQGVYLGEIDGFSDPAFLALDSNDDLFVPNPGTHQVDEYTR